MQLNEKGLLDRFIHVISIDELQLMLGKEFLENDMLTMFDIENQFIRITAWQILTSLFAIAMVTNDIVFGPPPNLEVSFKHRCKDEQLLTRH